MNKIKYLGIALAATLASCSTNDFDTAPAINGNGMITAYTPQSGESTRTAYEADGSNLKVTWSAADENMYTINASAEGWTAGQLKQVSATENGASANFNAYDIDGTKQVGYKAGKLFAFYPQNTTVASSFTSLSSGWHHRNHTSVFDRTERQAHRPPQLRLYDCYCRRIRQCR